MPCKPWVWRDLYLAARKQRGYAAAEALRATFGRRAARGLVAFVLPTATLDTVRRRFSIYAEMADYLPDEERAIVHEVLAERVEAERFRQSLARFDAMENR